MDVSSDKIFEAAATSLFQYFDKILPLEDNEKEALWTRLKERNITRRQAILQEDDVCTHYTYVVSGCLRMFNVDQKGGEHNIQFAAESDWICDIGSFFSERPSRLFIEAIEPSRILQIKKMDLYINYHKFDRNFRVIVENKFVELQNRVLQNISSTAEERYIAFLEQYPNLANRLPSTQVASYLGVTPEFLSKVRKSLARKS